MEIKNTLERYESLMQKFVDSLDHSQFRKKYQGRYETFSNALLSLAQLPQDRNLIVVELGTSRSFVDGAFPGCNSDDKSFWDPSDISKWDFGAGLFTYLASEFLMKNHPKFELYTVDLCEDHIERVKHMTRPFSSRITYVISDSVSFLKNFKTKCDLIYLDTGDMTPIEPTARLQLKEAETICQERLVNKSMFVLIDDVRHPTALEQVPGNLLGKAMYSVPYFLSQGYHIVQDEYQILLRAP